MEKEIVTKMTARRSARTFDEKYVIPGEDLNSLAEAIRMSPTSYGMENTKIIILKRGEFKDSLNELFYNQPNYISASAYILFVSDRSKKLKEYTIPKSAKAFLGDNEIAQRYINTINATWDKKFIPENGGTKDPDEWSNKQSYIGLGVAVVAATMLNIDTCPQEGFDADKIHAKLLENNYITKDEQISVGLALGKATIKSGSLDLPKHRMIAKEFINIIE